MSFERCMRIGALLLLVACGSNHAGEGREAQSAQTPGPEGATDATSADANASRPISSLERSDVKKAIQAGPGAFLRNVSVEDWPVMRDGKFYGFRIRALNPAWKIGLAPGDVVLRVNGQPIEHPEDADAALRSLETAPSLRVDYERDGKPGVFELPIVDTKAARANASNGSSAK